MDSGQSLRLAFGLLMCGLFGAWSAARAELVPLTGAANADRLCSMRVSPSPRPAQVAGCDRAWCTALGAERLCMCETASAGGGTAPRHEYVRVGAVNQPAQRWPAEVSPMLGAEAFSVTRADVDGDGRDDWIVEQRMAVSNGMGVAYGRLCTLGATAPAPACQDVEEWQSLTLLVREAGRTSCSLVDAGWESGIEPGRGEGTYALGRLMRFEQGRWQAVPATERPLVARRLLSSFERQRAGLAARNRTRLWYQHPRGAAVRCPDALCNAEHAR